MIGELLARAGSIFSRKSSAPASNSTSGRSFGRLLNARFDAAQTTPENAKHWAMADGLSANAAMTADVRAKIRNRARYESACNSFCRGLSLRIANDIVGTGPRLQLLIDDKKVSAEIEAAWAKWSKAIRLGQKLRTMRITKMIDGEVFALMGNNPGLVNAGAQLDLRLIDADRVTSKSLIEVEDEVDGIKFDVWGNPKSYNVLDYHPGDVSGLGNPMESTEYSAASMIHLFRADRPEQCRGLSEITSALPLFAVSRRYMDAVVGCAETAANIAFLLQTELPPDGTAEDVQSMENIDVPARSGLTLPAGWKGMQLKAEQPTTTFNQFYSLLRNEMICCILMPVNVATGDSSSYNYASGRLDHQTYYKAIRTERDEIETEVLDRLFIAFLQELVLQEGKLPQWMRMTGANIPHVWMWPGSEHVDPLKEAKAQETRLANRTTTYADEYARSGRDWEQAFAQIAKEQQLMTELGITPPAPSGMAPAGATANPASDEATEDEEESTNAD